MLNEIIRNKPNIIKNISANDLNTTSIHIFGDKENIVHLKNHTNLQELYITNIKIKELESVIKYFPDLKLLFLYNAQIEDLSILSTLYNAEFILINWNNKAKKLWNFSKQNKLIGLYFNDFKRLYDIDFISSALNLRYLDLEGGIDTKLKLKSLDSLAELKYLEELTLLNLSVEKNSLNSITKITQLKFLNISNQFDTEEYAMLSVKMRNTKCDYFKPYVELKSTIEDKNIMVVGKRKPFLNTEKDKLQLEKYIKNFKKLQKKYE